MVGSSGRELKLESELNKMLGGVPIESIDEFVSANARRVAATFGVSFNEIPYLIRANSLHGEELEMWPDKVPPEVMALAVPVFALQAMILYETADR